MVFLVTDTIQDHNAVRNLVKHFQAPEIAIGGFKKINRPDNLKIQQIN